MQIDNILVGPNPKDPRTFVLHAEVAGFKYTGYFADMGGFLTAVSEMGQFFAIKTGRMKSKDQTLSRVVLNA